jgi:hypothetical protein
VKSFLMTRLTILLKICGGMDGNSDFDASIDSSASDSDGVLYEIIEFQNSD